MIVSLAEIGVCGKEKPLEVGVRSMVDQITLTSNGFSHLADIALRAARL